MQDCGGNVTLLENFEASFEEFAIDYKANSCCSLLEQRCCAPGARVGEPSDGAASFLVCQV